MRKTFVGAMLFATAAIVSIDVRPAAADAGWEVCSLLYHEGGTVTACNYRTFDQCKATAGNSGFCFQNPERQSPDRSFARMRGRRG